jgi:hypothetical protein
MAGITAIVLGTLIWTGLPAPAPSAGAVENKLSADLDLVPRDGAGFVTFQVASLLASDQAKAAREQLAKSDPKAFQEYQEAEKRMETNAGMMPQDIQRVTVFMPSLDARAPIGALAMVKPVDRQRLLKAVHSKSKEAKIGERTYYTKEGEGNAAPAIYFVDDRTLLMGEPDHIEKFLEGLVERKREGPLDGALNLAQKHQLVVGLNPPAILKHLENQLPPLPQQFQPLLSVQSVILTADAGKDLQVNLDAKFPANEAKDGAEAVKAGLATVADFLGQGIQQIQKSPDGYGKMLGILAKAQAALKAGPVKQDGATVQVRLSLPTDLTALVAAQMETTAQVAGTAARLTSINNLKQMALAMHAYHDVSGSLPAHAIYSKDGKPLLSWRVAILPYIEQDALYKEFNLDEPWDSEHNKKLLARMPKIFEPVQGIKTKEPYSTFYQVFTGKDAPFNGDKGLQLAAGFPDGTSNTILIAEAGEAVPWTKPVDMPFAMDKPLPKLGGLSKGGFHVAMADGSVRFVNLKKVSEKTLRNAINPHDGEALGSDWGVENGN